MESEKNFFERFGSYKVSLIKVDPHQPGDDAWDGVDLQDITVQQLYEAFRNRFQDEQESEAASPARTG